MAKITINPIPGSYASVTALNARMDQIETTFNDNILWRDGVGGEPNAMAVDLDMGGNGILNFDWGSATDLLGNSILDYLADAEAASIAAALSAANAATSETNASASETAAQAAQTAAEAAQAAAEAAAASVGFPEGTNVQSTGEAANLVLTSDGLDGASWQAAACAASNVSIVDAGAYFTSADVEGALQELGAAGGGGDTPVQSATIGLAGTAQIVASSIPAGVNRITINIIGALQAVANSCGLRLGHSGGTIVTTGYSWVYRRYTTTTHVRSTSGSGCIYLLGHTAAQAHDVRFELSRNGATSNNWQIRVIVEGNNYDYKLEGLGNISLPSQLTDVQMYANTTPHIGNLAINYSQ